MTLHERQLVKMKRLVRGTVLESMKWAALTFFVSFNCIFRVMKSSLNRFFPLYLSIKGQNHGLQPGIAFTVGVAAVGILPEFLAWC